MKESKKYKGLWYLPGQSEKPVAGILYYKKAEIIILELIGSISEGESSTPGFIFDYDSRPDMIYGESSDGEKITLLYCHSGGSSYTFACSFPLTSYQCEYVVIGKHLLSPKENCFNIIKILTPAMPQWVFSSLVKLEIGYEKDSMSGLNINVNQKQDVHSAFNIVSKFNFSLISSAAMSGQEIYPERVKISQYSFFHIESLNSASKKTHSFHKNSRDRFILVGNFFVFLTIHVRTKLPPKIHFFTIF